jgi:hypothetical protein
MVNDMMQDVRHIVRQTVEAGLPYLDADRCTLLIEAADRGDLSTVHDLLVEGMIELRGADFTRRLLEDADNRHGREPEPGFLH